MSMPRDDVAEEARAWLDANWDPERTVREWWAMCAQAGWQYPHWPEGLGGRGVSVSDARAVSEQFVEVGALGPPAGLGQVMGGPVVLNHGSGEQRARLVPPLATGAEGWCQFFSEPEAGSDLAGLRTRAERDGDEWVVTGQKVWTSGARQCVRGMLVARTNWEVPKHRGLSYFIIEVDQPGIEIRPLKQMNGAAHFNEVFFTEARVSDVDRIGAEGDGWAVAVATLAFERSGLSSRMPGLTTATPGDKGGHLDLTCGRAVGGGDDDETTGRQAMLSIGAVRDLATGRGRTSDPTLRDDMVDATIFSRVSRWNMQRARAGAKPGGQPGVEANLAKLAGSRSARQSQSLAPRVLGAEGMLSGPAAPAGGAVTDMVLSVPASSIAGGSDEVQRNIIGERGLGLPKDIQVDRDVPFSEVRRSGQGGGG